MTVLNVTIISNLVRDCIAVEVTVFLMWLEGAPWLGMRDPKQTDRNKTKTHLASDGSSKIGLFFRPSRSRLRLRLVPLLRGWQSFRVFEKNTISDHARDSTEVA